MDTNDEGLRRMYRLVNTFLTRNDCEPFRQPVQWQALGLFDYPKIIKKVSHHFLCRKAYFVDTQYNDTPC